MAKLKRGEKTKAVRDYMATNPSASPKEIVAGLAATGMKIKLGLANSLKYGRKARQKRGRRKTPSIRIAARHTKNGSVTVEQLIEVKKLADFLGGLDQIRAALDALEQLR